MGEKDHLVKVGWKYEGIGWYSDTKKAVPLYRAYNPNAKAGSHNYTVNYAEQKNLIRVGWRDEGIAWYGINKTTPVTKYTVTVKHVGSDGKTLKTATASVEKGKSYTAKAGSFSGYTLKGGSSQTVTVNGNKTVTFNYTKNAVTPTKYTVTIKYVDTSNNTLKPATTASIEKGKPYTATAPTIPGYTLKGNGTQTVNAVNSDQTLTFTYTKNAVPVTKYMVTVKYVDTSNNTIKTAETASIEKGKPYTATAPTIPGYTLKGNGTQTVNAVNSDQTLTFTYTKNAVPVTKYTVTVKYVDTSNNTIKTATTASIEKGKPYTATAPTITGYTLKGNGTQTINAVNSDQTLTFTYTKNAVPVTKYTVTVKYVDTSNNTIKTAETASIEKGKPYTATAPTITGYTLKGNGTQTVNAVNSDQTLTFTYTKNAVPVTKYTVTVKYVDTSNNTIKTATTASIEKGKPYTATAPTIPGYTLKGNGTQTVNAVNSDQTLTFTYTKNAVPVTKYTVTVKYVDTSNNTIKTATTASIEKGKPYTATAPAITGYKLKGNDTQTISAVTSDATLTFVYNNLAFDKITLHAVVDGKIVKSVTFEVKPGEKFKPSSDKLNLDPDVYDLVYTWSYAEITGVGGRTDEYRFNILLFKQYLSESELVIMQQTIVQKVNELRVSLGRSPLVENSKLSAAAAVRSIELKEKFEHVRPDGRDIYTAVTEQGLSIGYPRGENIAMVGDPNNLTSGEIAGLAMFEGWKNSNGHYLNMIDPGYKYIGIGVYCYGSKVFGTQLFAGVIN